MIGPKIDLTFTSKLYFAAPVQYYSQIYNINLNACFHWRCKPASCIYGFYRDNYSGDAFRSKNRALVSRITYRLNVQEHRFHGCAPHKRMIVAVYDLSLLTLIVRILKRK